jgi:hypothetical protein
VRVVGDDPHRWHVLDRWGCDVEDDVKVTGTCSLVAAAREPLSTFTLPTGSSRLDTLTAFTMGALDHLSAVAKKELSVEEHEGAFTKLAAEVRRLADKPAAPITVKAPDVHVNVPEQPPVKVEVDYSKLPPPQVHVHQAPPPRRGVRVDVDAVTGEKTYVPFDLPEEGEEA